MVDVDHDGGEVEVESLEAEKKRESWLVARLVGLSSAGQGMGVVLSMLAYGSGSRVLELLTPFRMQYLLVSVGVALVAGICRKRVLGILAVVGILLNGWHVGSLYVSAGNGSEASGASSAEISMVSLNVFTGNQEPEKVLAYLEEQTPEVLLLMEVNDRWMERLAVLKERYKHAVAQPESDNFGIAFYTNLEVESLELVDYLDCGIPSVRCVATVDGKRVTIIGTHPVPPIGKTYYGMRNEQLKAIAGELAEADGRALVVGDFNMSSWSSHFGSFMEQTGLRDSRKGFGLCTSWPTTNPLLAITIDHLLVSDGIEVLERGTGPVVGSDHRAVEAKIRLD